RATASNQPHSLGDGKPRLKWPIANLPLWCANGCQRLHSFVFQRVGHNSLENSARNSQRHVVFMLLEGSSAIGVSLLHNRAQLRPMNKFEPATHGRICWHA